jgi:hypothetical protein
MTKNRGAQKESPDAAAVRRASQKLQDGDIREAVRALYSEETVAPLSTDTLASLRQKHPPAPRRPASSTTLELLIHAGDIG